MADSDSNIAWHRTQLKRDRQALRDIEVRKFRFGEMAGAKAQAETRRLVADLRRKITASERIIGTYEKQTRRPLTTDSRSLASVRWGNWDSAPCNNRALDAERPLVRRAS